MAAAVDLAPFAKRLAVAANYLEAQAGLDRFASPLEHLAEDAQHLGALNMSLEAPLVQLEHSPRLLPRFLEAAGLQVDGGAVKRDLGELNAHVVAPGDGLDARRGLPHRT